VGLRLRNKPALQYVRNIDEFELRVIMFERHKRRFFLKFYEDIRDLQFPNRITVLFISRALYCITEPLRFDIEYTYIQINL